MNKTEFIGKALEIGTTVQEACWLEMIYSKDPAKVTVKDNHMLMDYFATCECDSDKLLELCTEYENMGQAH